MKKGLQEGFTLSELLITLAVVGVVAAITIPQLVTGLSKKQTGSQLSRTVSQIELGCQNLIQYENSKVTDGSYINSLSAVPNLSVQKLAPFIGAIDSDESVSTGNIKDYAYMTAPLFMQSAYALSAPLLDTGSSPIAGTNVVDSPYPVAGGSGFLREVETTIEGSGGGTVTLPSLPSGSTSSSGSTPGHTYTGNGLKDSTGGEGLLSGWGKTITGVKAETKTETETESKNNQDSGKVTGEDWGEGVVTVLGGVPENSENPTTSNNPEAGNKVVLQFLIDVNGSDKKPNAYGKDIFEFSLTDSCKVVPYGLKTYKTDCVKGNVTDGRACAARVVADGWKIKY